MGKSCCAAAGSPVVRYTPVAFALAALLAMVSPADAASIGHSRLVSAPGQPLRIDVPIRDLTESEQQSLRVTAAPLSSWQQAGLTPPVELSTLQISVEPGFSADSRRIQVRSSQPFTGVVADLLLQISTSVGSQQHQVSLLAGASQVASDSGQSVSSVSGPSGVSVGAQSSRGTITVRRGDTLFALARANAVEGVTVYQMMVALQKANPQAFIEGNINLVKAGATLAIPDTAALRAISDREARRIFQQHTQAFAEYRQRIASRQGGAVAGGSTQSGPVVAGESEAPLQVAPPASGDQVVLSSGSGADPDAQADEQHATQRNIEESQARVSQLERNVQSLNQALQMQGEAAKDAVVEGAAAVGQTLSEAAASIGLSSGEPESASVPGQSAQAVDGQSGVQGTVPAGQAGTSGDQAAGLAPQDNGQAQAGSTAGTEGDPASSPTSQAGSDAGNESVTTPPASPAEASTRADTSQPDASTSDTVSAQSGAQSQSGSAANGGAGAMAPDSGVALSVPGRSGAAQTNESNPSISSKAEQPVSWIQQNLLGVITAILALVVLIIAWVLRRASASRSEGQGVVTEAMVQERLEQIDLDLSNPPSDERPPKAG